MRLRGAGNAWPDDDCDFAAAAALVARSAFERVPGEHFRSLARDAAPTPARVFHLQSPSLNGGSFSTLLTHFIAVAMRRAAKQIVQ